MNAHDNVREDNVGFFAGDHGKAFLSACGSMNDGSFHPGEHFEDTGYSRVIVHDKNLLCHRSFPTRDHL